MHISILNGWKLIWINVKCRDKCKKMTCQKRNEKFLLEQIEKEN